MKRKERLNKERKLAKVARCFPVSFSFSSRKVDVPFARSTINAIYRGSYDKFSRLFSLSRRNEYIFSTGEKGTRLGWKRATRMVFFDTDTRGARDVNPVANKKGNEEEFGEFVLWRCPAVYIPVPLNGLSLWSALILKRWIRAPSFEIVCVVTDSIRTRDKSGI